jgi:hypothetical protein
MLKKTVRACKNAKAGIGVSQLECKQDFSNIIAMSLLNKLKCFA